MDAINHTFRSYYQVTRPAIGFGWPAPLLPRVEWEEKDATVSKIRLSPGYPVKSFEQLVEVSARTGLSNTQYEFFYRGQFEDHKDKNSKTVIYPAICRPDLDITGKPKASVKTATIEKRFEKLQEFISFSYKYQPSFVEHAYALIQHYEIMPTPLIDITQSLRVAASFALIDGAKQGYVYMFGLPYPHGSISHFIDIGVTLIKLQNAVPHNALRPRYQEGFLVGRLPFRPEKAVGDNLAKRLIGKFFLDDTEGGFWNDIFKPYPRELLFPEGDVQKDRMNRLYSEFTKHKRSK